MLQTVRDIHPADSSAQNLTRNDLNLLKSPSDPEGKHSFSDDGHLTQWGESCFRFMQHKAQIPPPSSGHININRINYLISLSRGAGGETPALQLHHPLFPRPRGGLPWQSQRDPVGHPLSALGRPVPSRASLLPKHIRVQVSARRSDGSRLWVLIASLCESSTEKRLCRTDTRGISKPGVISLHANSG